MYVYKVHPRKKQNKASSHSLKQVYQLKIKILKNRKKNLIQLVIRRQPSYSYAQILYRSVPNARPLPTQQFQSPARISPYQQL